MKRLIWRARARHELRAILDYISERNAIAADNLLARIDGCTEHLPEHPFMFRAGRRKGTREAVVHPNYILVYRVLTKTVEVVSVMHTRRQYPPAE